MYFIVIDIGKNTHVASMIDKDKNTIFKDYSISNNLEAVKAFCEKIAPYKDCLEIGMEATDHYH